MKFKLIKFHTLLDSLLHLLIAYTDTNSTEIFRFKLFVTKKNYTKLFTLSIYN